MWNNHEKNTVEKCFFYHGLITGFNNFCSDILFSNKQANRGRYEKRERALEGMNEDTVCSKIQDIPAVRHDQGVLFKTKTTCLLIESICSAIARMRGGALIRRAPPPLLAGKSYFRIMTLRAWRLSPIQENLNQGLSKAQCWQLKFLGILRRDMQI